MAATLGSIAFNLMLCMFATFLSLIWFGVAVRVRRFNALLAPRTWARPSSILQNVMIGSFKIPGMNGRSRRSGLDAASAENAGAETDVENERARCPNKSIGCYGLAWLSWAYSVTYREMIEGIPGTGTRANGRAGPLLKTNLDGLILIRFYAMCLRVCCLSTFLFCGVLLPLYIGAGCNSDFLEAEDPRCEHVATLTDYGRTTLSHVPSLSPSGGIFTSITVEPGLLVQLVTVVIVAWVVCAYTCAQLWREWVENLALRRVFYLEQNHWKKRKQEIQRQINLSHEEEPFQRLRPPWLPHPELRETVPNVDVQTVLCELPEKPSDVKTHPEDEGAPVAPPEPQSGQSYYGTKHETKREWQLAEATKFFDSCIPNQPGYSSSVAAVTILPEATLLGAAWRRWILAGRQVRRTRFIQQLITERLVGLEEEGILDEDDPVVIEARMHTIPIDRNRPGLVRYKLSDYGPCAKEFAIMSSGDRRNPNIAESCGGDVNEPEVHTPDDLAFKNFDKSKLGYSQLFGMTKPGSRFHGPESESEFEEFVDEFGIEQTAAYSRAFAESGGGCCPRGCCTGRLRRSNLEQLLTELKQTQEKANTTYEALLEARNDVHNFANGHQHRNLFGFENGASDFFNDDDNDSDSKSSADEEEGSNLLGRSILLDHHSRTSSARQWNRVSGIIRHSKEMRSSGRNNPTVKKSQRLLSRFIRHVSSSVNQMTCYWGKAILNSSRRPTYAAVTFTSRQAAAAARQCLADGSGLRQWEQHNEIPVPPLADAPAGTVFTTYGWCLPITVAISDGERAVRRAVAILSVVTVYFFYTIPLSYATTIFSPENLGVEYLSISRSTSGGLVNSRSSGFIAGGIYNLFFFTCPFLFKAIANFGSGAISVRQAEYIATNYYWWFILLTAFTGSSLTTMLLNGFDSGFTISSEFQALVVTVAAVVPTQLSATWISWIILKTFVTIPLSYLCNVPAFMMECCRLNYFSRVIRGRGPGAPVPFRIFVDAGTVVLCVLALGPAAPLVAPFGLLFFLITTPVLKWCLIFVYRPMWDDGGRRWPQLFNMVVSALILSQIILAAMMALKEAVIPALVAGIAIIPTAVFSTAAKRQFARAYQDVGLMQTSRLDGWDSSSISSYKTREEYRKWLVDAHKASYIPACLVGSDNILTAEPSMTIHLEYDSDTKVDEPDRQELRSQRPRALTASSLPIIRGGSVSSNSESPSLPIPWPFPKGQRGVILRRIPRNLLAKERANSSAERSLDSLDTVETT